MHSTSPNQGLDRDTHAAGPAAMDGVAFGPFLATLQSRELFKNGRRIRIQDKPFLVLQALLERPGEVVEREELRQRLWPDDEFGEFDLGLNTAVKKLRQALDDSASTPRFVETLPRIGYRFICPLERPANEPDTADGSGARSWRSIAAVAAGAFVGVAVLAHVLNRPSVLEDDAPEQVVHPVPLTAYLGNEWNPSFSPDGSQVAFDWDGGDLWTPHDLYVKAIGSDHALQLTDTKAHESRAAWSPDGRHIAFLRTNGRPFDLWLISPTGGSERKLAESISRASWMPDSTALVVARVRTPEKSDRLELVPIDGGPHTPLIEPPPNIKGDGPGVAVSPDGAMLAFARDLGFSISDGEFDENSGVAKTGLFVADMSGNRAPRLLVEAWTRGVAWTPDSKEIVFSNLDGIWRIAADASLGDPPTRLVGAEGPQLAVSRYLGNGTTRMAFQYGALGRDILRTEIVRNRESPPRLGESQPFLSSSRAEAGPQYSPDGSKVAFVSDRSGSWRIWVADANGEDARVLSDLKAENFSWSPDGRTIAQSCRGVEPSEPSTLCLVEVVSGRIERVEPPCDCGVPAWDPSGEYVYVGSTGDKNVIEAYRLNLKTGEKLRLTTGGGRPLFVSPDGSTLYYSASPGYTMLPIWAVPTAGGTPQKLDVEFLQYFLWPTDEGSYFLQLEGNDPHLRFYELATGTMADLGPVPENLARNNWTQLSVSPDGRWLVSSHYDPQGTDLFLIEDLR